MESKTKAAAPAAPGARILIVAARYYDEVVDQLIAGARAVLEGAGARVEIVEVPGAFETPAAIGFAEEQFDGFVALGCVVRGETSHYDYVCGESARGLMELALNGGLCIGYGILTVETLAQALERANPAGRDKGGEAARACLSMIALKRRFADPDA